MRDPSWERLQDSDIFARLDAQHVITMNIATMYRDGMSFAEIAKRVGMSDTGAANRLRYALDLAARTAPGVKRWTGSLCLHCHEPITGSAGKRFCGAACRMADMRKRKATT